MSDRRRDNRRGFRQDGRGAFGWLGAAFVGLLLSCVVVAPAAATVYTRAFAVSNSAEVDFDFGQLAQSAVSNTVTTQVCTQATLEFLKYAPAAPDAQANPVPQSFFCPAGSSCNPAIPQGYVAVPVTSGMPPGLGNGTLPLVKADIFRPYFAGETIFLRLNDGDRNTDPAIAETVALTLSFDTEEEALLLTETGPDSGVFVGFIRSMRHKAHPVAAGDGVFSIKHEAIKRNSPILARYDDLCDTVDGVVHLEIEADALVDPFGIVFDSQTGEPIDGATVALVDVTTGNPAAVFGDDGVSVYPPTLISGGDATDAGGTFYDFDAGFYRFPLLFPGNYRLAVTPPAGYTFPSAVADADMQLLPDAPFALTVGSRGEVFVVNPGPALHIDIPLDPILNILWVTKSAAKATVATGDFLRYDLTVQNRDDVRTAFGVVVTDRLPLGMRYRAGSTFIDDVRAPDPTIAADGRSLFFPVGDLPPEQTVTIRFVVEVGAGARPGKAVNYASAAGNRNERSNLAQAAVMVIEDLYRSVAFIVGRVFPNACGEDQNVEGVGGVRIFMEDGRYAVTDKFGKYHFPAVNPGSHVVQIDLTTLPDEYELIACEENSRFSQTAYSQFVDIQGGGLWRADFYMARRMAQVQGEARIELTSALVADTLPQTASEALSVVLHPRFESGSAELTNADREQLHRLAESLKELAVDELKVAGHTDSQGLSARLRAVYPDNQALSLARAGRVAAYLAVALDLTPEQVDIAGFGPDQPVADNATPEGRARNRRVELTVGARRAIPEAAPRPAEIAYRVPLQVGATALDNARLTILLPTGLSYVKGSSRRDGEPLAEPSNVLGSLTYPLGRLEIGATPEVTFMARIDGAGLDEGQWTTEALLTFDTPIGTNLRTPLVSNVVARRVEIRRQSLPPLVLRPAFASGNAELTARDRSLLDATIASLQGAAIEELQVTGHTDPQPISARLRSTYADNYALSIARARSVADYLAAGLQLDPERIVVDGKGPFEPVASNATADGMALNRRVELRLTAAAETVWPELRNTKEASGIEEAAFDKIIPWTRELGQAPVRPGPEVAEAAPRVMPKYDNAWLRQATPGLELLWPPENFYPALPVVSVAVKHDPMATLVLTLNGQPIDPFYFDGAKRRGDLLVAVSQWFGVRVVEGPNHFEAIEYRADGTVRSRLARTIHLSSPPVKAELLAEQPGAIADGKNPVAIAVRLTDKDGHPARQGMVGEFRVDPPYRPWDRMANRQGQPLAAATTERERYVIGEDGVALLTLHPTTQTGEAVLRLTLGGEEKELRAWLAPDYRDWILVALVEGTVGYNTASGNMESLGAMDEEQDYYDEGRVAFYAKGQVKGEWLLTMAYDTAKKPLHDRPGLYQTIDPNQYYMLYGDEAEVRYDAPSSKKLYLRIERSQFYALFGDFSTGLGVTELTKYSRQLTGLKSEYKGRHFGYTAFAADSHQAFMRDEIPGDGTSGLYRLSRQNIVINSETVAIETRDRFRSEEVILRRELLRHLDYTIDYDSGTIFFKAPVFSRDSDFNPNTIVVEYESFDRDDSAWTYGGRAALRLFDQRLEVGATYVHEGVTGGEATLAGVDASVKLTTNTTLRAELATTDNNLPTATATTPATPVASGGEAWLAELQHLGERLAATAYLREQKAGFGLGQQAQSETGTRKIGGNASYRLGEPWLLGGELYRQEDLTTATVRDMAEVRGDYRAERYALHSGLRHAEESFPLADDRSSDQIFLGGTYRVTSRLSLLANHDQTVSNNQSSDYPTQTTIGADYRLSEATTLNAAQEWSYGDGRRSELTRVGMSTSPWEGGTIGSTIERQISENGARVFATTGLRQTWQYSERLTLDAGLDRSQTLRPSTERANNFTAVSGGAGYQVEKWAYTARAEYRHSTQEDKYNLLAGVHGEVRDGLALAGSWQTMLSLADTANKINHDIRLGVAYRPLMPRTIILDRLEYREDRLTKTASPTTGRRLINNLALNYKPNRVTQLTLNYGAKYVLETIDDADYSGFTDLLGLEGRHDITKRWDVGARLSTLHSWSLEQRDYGAGVSVGYSPAKNIWASLGYNLLGFYDRDFSRADFTAQGPYLTLRLKLDQTSVRDAVRWYNGQ